jgi:hypothetical protein
VINLRYHIVSITAVFLALGIGLTLGSSFLDRVTVDNLESQLTEVEEQVRETRDDNRALNERKDRLEERDAALAAELPEQLFAGHLTGVPVLVVATRGTDEELVATAVEAIAASGAEVAGTWWLTDRWDLDDADEVNELGQLLELSSEDAVRLRRNSAIRLSELLLAASQPPPAEDSGIAGPEPSEPPLVASLAEAGFLDHEPLPGAADTRALLPGAGARYLVVSGSQPDDGSQAFATALLDELAAETVAPVVASQGAVSLPDDDQGRAASEDEQRSTFVGPLREGELTRVRISTTDHLDTAAGLAALVLALEDVGAGSVGHFGVAPGAARLLPEPQR